MKIPGLGGKPQNLVLPLFLVFIGGLMIVAGINQQSPANAARQLLSNGKVTKVESTPVPTTVPRTIPRQPSSTATGRPRSRGTQTPV